jgi:hypothetical protein
MERPSHRESTGSGRLLLADRVHDQVTREPDLHLREGLGGGDHGGDATLHVACTPAVNDTVLEDGREGIVAPALARLHRDDVDVAVEEECSAIARPPEARHELWPTGERKTLGSHRVARDQGLIGLPQANLGPVITQALCEHRLECSLVPVAVEPGVCVVVSKRISDWSRSTSSLSRLPISSHPRCSSGVSVMSGPRDSGRERCATLGSSRAPWIP